MGPRSSWTGGGEGVGGEGVEAGAGAEAAAAGARTAGAGMSEASIGTAFWTPPTRKAVGVVPERLSPRYFVTLKKLSPVLASF